MMKYDRTAQTYHLAAAALKASLPVTGWPLIWSLVAKIKTSPDHHARAYTIH